MNQVTYVAAWGPRASTACRGWESLRIAKNPSATHIGFLRDPPASGPWQDPDRANTLFSLDVWE
jgi:hypothetical protein